MTTRVRLAAAIVLCGLAVSGARSRGPSPRDEEVTAGKAQPAGLANNLGVMLQLDNLLDRYGSPADPAQPLKGTVHTWEIVNEPNYRWPPDQYAILLAEAYDVLKADAGAKVVFGGLGGDVLGQSKDVRAGNQINYFEK